MTWEREDREYEFNAAFDSVSERFAGEFSPCWNCGALTVDAGGHCEGRFDDEDGAFEQRQAYLDRLSADISADEFWPVGFDPATGLCPHGMQAGWCKFLCGEPVVDDIPF
jgi:hypothetical protein